MKQEKLTGYVPKYPRKALQRAALTAAALAAIGGVTGCQKAKLPEVTTEGLVSIETPGQSLVLDGEVATEEPTEEPALQGKVFVPEPADETVTDGYIAMERPTEQPLLVSGLPLLPTPSAEG